MSDQMKYSLAEKQCKRYVEDSRKQEKVFSEYPELKETMEKAASALIEYEYSASVDDFSDLYMEAEDMYYKAESGDVVDINKNNRAREVNIIQIDDGQICRVYRAGGEFIGLYRFEAASRRFKPHKMFL